MPKPRQQQHEATANIWPSSHAYIFATMTLVLGLVLGYLFGKSGTVQSAAAAPASTVPLSAPSGSGLLGEAPATPHQVVDAMAQPMIAQLESNPNDAGLLARIGHLYYDSKHYPKAIEYYKRSLAVNPADPNVRTDMGTAMWYSGDADAALKEYAQSLKFQPGHANTLFNTGIVRWQGKSDATGALEAWRELLVTNPKYPERARVEELIREVRGSRP